jgi:hypothetical protein
LEDVGLDDATRVPLKLGILVVIASVKHGALLELSVEDDCVGATDEVKLPNGSGAQFILLTPSSKQRQKGFSKDELLGKMHSPRPKHPSGQE